MKAKQRSSGDSGAEHKGGSPDGLFAEKRLRRLGNSVGLWMFLFAGFGLVSLSLCEEKIQNRMQRNYQRMTQLGYLSGSRQSPAEVDRANGTDQPAAAVVQPYIYRLTGLRWILILTTVGGFAQAILVWTGSH